MSLLIDCNLVDNRKVRYTSWNEVFENAINIKELDCLNNELTSLPVEIGNLVNLEILNCSFNSLTSLPESIGNLNHLKELYIHANQLTSLPESIGNYMNLKELKCAFNQLNSLPESIGNLTNLQRLLIHNNQLTSLSESIGNLTNLKEFNCSHSELNSLPEWIGNLSNLEILHCSYNQLTSLPEWIGNLENLEVLNCSFNQLTSLPESIENLRNLEILNCRSNQLISLPIQLIQCRNLTDFQFHHNPIEFIPEVLLRRIHQIRNIRNHNGIYHDGQNVHLSSIQTSLKISIFNLLNDRNQISNEDLIQMILNSSLNESIKSFLIQQFKSEEIHSTLQVSFVDVLQKVILRIESNEHKEELYQRLNQEMIESFEMCFTGRLTRLVNTLVGFYEDIRIEISSNEQISVVISQIKIRHHSGDEEDLTDEVKDEIRRELRERGYEDSVIEEWISI